MRVGPRRGAFVLAFVASAQLCALTGSSSARVDPLRLLAQQIPKVNMLVVLDTSGSLTGVPGSTFGPETEAGVDCDDGVDCRGWGTPGGCAGAPVACAPVLGTGCPDGTEPTGPNLIFNGNFTIPAGPGPGVAAAAGFTAGVPNVGDFQYAPDTTISVQSGNVNYAGGLVTQRSFPGDPCGGVPATAGWLYANGNHTGARYKVWEQVVNGLAPNTRYTLWAYVSNTISHLASYSPTVLPTWTFQKNGVDLGAALVLPNERDTSEPDHWKRVQFTFLTGPAEVSATLSLWDTAVGVDGDDAGITALTLRACQPIVAGVCKSSSATCTNNAGCGSVGRCQQGNFPCSNVGGTCGGVGVCNGVSPTKHCLTSDDCPRATADGVCSVTGTVCQGWCPSVRSCSLDGVACTTDADCPDFVTGRCAENNAKHCGSNADCTSGCVFTPNFCAPSQNVCVFPRRACLIAPGPNTCVATPDTCVPVSQVRATCEEAGQQLKMCRDALTVCTADADCPAGDSCGPPTSRAVILKRVLKRTIEESHGLVNYGLMTFAQDGYFPYYLGAPAAAGSTTVELITRERLVDAGCYAGSAVPSAACAVDGRAYTRRDGPNSRYRVATGPTTTIHADRDYCGETCIVDGRTGTYVGSHYQLPAAAVPAGSTGRMLRDSYQGPTLTDAGDRYAYYTPNARFYNGGETPAQAGFAFDDCDATKVCGARCGGRWDTRLAPFLDVAASAATARDNALAVAARLEKAQHGGVVTFGGESTPTGCTLDNVAMPAVPGGERYSAWDYMDRVLTAIEARYGVDRAGAKACRPNYVLYVTDGAPKGPGDALAAAAGTPAETACAAAACSAADPVAANCPCDAVKAAYRLRTQLGVKTLVVGYGADANSPAARAANDNIAKAGGTDALRDGVAPYAYTALRETELEQAVRDAVNEAARGSYTTAPGSATAGLQTNTGEDQGAYVLDTRVDVPSWKGHLVAYDVSGTTPRVVWDAATELERMNWWERRVYVGTTPAPVRMTVDPGSKTVTNAAALHALGLGASASEAAEIARWMLGDPRLPNRALLGAIVNSTPIEVGPPPEHPWPGGHEFAEAHKDRPRLVYVGADDGMLHAFFAQDTVVGGVTRRAGSEAFAFIPRDMLATINRLWAQGGQPADPAKHIFGLASSPKVKHLCVSACASSATAVWKTVLAMGEGFGGNDLFLLDITRPFAATGFADPPVTQLWASERTAEAAEYHRILGETISVPAFFFEKTDSLDQHRMMFTSGYRVDSTQPEQGHHLVVANAADGDILRSERLDPGALGCTQAFTALTDVATARDNYRSLTFDSHFRLLAGYTGDTWGNLWRYDAVGELQKVAALGCTQPLHFAPTVVQLDRDLVGNRRGQIFLAQVTNSSLDEVTAGFAPSQLVILKDAAGSDLDVESVTDFAPGGRLVVAATQICARRENGACAATLPATARPIATPTALLMDRGGGFKLLSLWYVPPTGCGKGETFLAVHDFLDTPGGPTLSQPAAVTLGSEAVLGTVVTSAGIFVVTSNGLVEVGRAAGITIIAAGQAGQGGPGGGRFRRLAWTEVP